MLFNSWAFVAFFLVVYLLTLRQGLRAQNLTLLAASYAFYALWDYRFLALILASTAVDYLVGRGLARQDDPRSRRCLLAVSVCTNLGLLGVFKYFDFFMGGLDDLLLALGLSSAGWSLGVVVPVGISFYTFQTLSYTIDIYRRELEPCDDPLDFALFVAFFPQLIAGPIERARNLLPQLQRPRVLDATALREGAWWLLHGYFLKVFGADNLAVIADGAFSAAEPTGAVALLGTVAFTWQIYCDFAGYSAIARGLARLLGVELMANFCVPYLATNPREFWQRWHISLSSWLRDYLYVPLGGNRSSAARTGLNLMTVMLLGGLWHGAAWRFVLWGLYQGGLLVLFRSLSRRTTLEPRLSAARVARALAFLPLTSIGWVIFRCDHLGQITAFPSAWVGSLGWTVWDTHTALTVAFLLAPIVALDLVQEHARGDPSAPLGWPWPARWALYLAMTAAIAVFGSRGGEAFIYFQF